jgi:hypothetical protein
MFQGQIKVLSQIDHRCRPRESLGHGHIGDFPLKGGKMAPR